MEDSIDSLDTVAFAQALARAASDTQATDIVILDLRGLVSYTDGFVLCSGKNRRHVTAIAEAVRMEAKRGYGIAPLGVEGKERGQWVLDNFEDLKSKFVKVMPVDYKRVLAEQAGKSMAAAG